MRFLRLVEIFNYYLRTGRTAYETTDKWPYDWILPEENYIVNPPEINRKNKMSNANAERDRKITERFDPSPKGDIYDYSDPINWTRLLDRIGPAPELFREDRVWHFTVGDIYGVLESGKGKTPGEAVVACAVAYL